LGIDVFVFEFLGNEKGGLLNNLQVRNAFLVQEVDVFESASSEDGGDISEEFGIQVNEVAVVLVLGALDHSFDDVVSVLGFLDAFGEVCRDSNGGLDVEAGGSNEQGS